MAHVPGPRNQPVKDFLLRAGFQETSPDVLETTSFDALALPEHVSWSPPAASPMKRAG